MKIEIKKGNEVLLAEIAAENLIAVLNPQSLPENTNGEEIVQMAMKNPIASSLLKDAVHKGEKIAIIASDNTRPVPTYQILPSILKELYEAGIDKEDITLYFARGSHRAMTDAEREALAGSKAFHEIACVDSDTEHTSYVGTTKRGTEVEIDSRVVKADRRICIGNVEYHYFAGYSGGAKAIMPGMSTPRSIAMNHRLMIDMHACAGVIQGNPVREDLEEACAMVGVDFIVNVVLNTHKEIIYAAAGDVTEAHRDACRYLDSVYRSPIPARADIVIVSQGGAPKDRNLYQTQKALDNAKHAVKDGGTIIVVGSCSEGFGQDKFAEWMLKYRNPDDMLQALHEHFVLGGHKAAAIGLVRKKAQLFLVSDMDPETVKKTFFIPFKTLQEAYNCAAEKYGKNASVIVMPYGGSTLPCVKEDIHHEEKEG